LRRRVRRRGQPQQLVVVRQVSKLVEPRISFYPCCSCFTRGGRFHGVAPAPHGVASADIDATSCTFLSSTRPSRRPPGGRQPHADSAGCWRSVDHEDAPPRTATATATAAAAAAATGSRSHCLVWCFLHDGYVQPPGAPCRGSRTLGSLRGVFRSTLSPSHDRAASAGGSGGRSQFRGHVASADAWAGIAPCW
jgi:hypothetical protein